MSEKEKRNDGGNQGRKKDRSKSAIFWNGTLFPTPKKFEIGMFSN